MTYRETLLLEALLSQDDDYFYPYEISFLINISRYMRFSMITRSESLKLLYLGDKILDKFTIYDGYPDFFEGVSVSPRNTFESSPAGGPSHIRPEHSGDGINFAQFGLRGGSINLSIRGI